MGWQPEIAIQCATINPARHMRIDQWVGSIAPGRYADMVLLDDVKTPSIRHVYADGKLVSEGKTFTAPAGAENRLARLGEQDHEYRGASSPRLISPSRPSRAASTMQAAGAAALPLERADETLAG